jgi:hypothetical protein
MGCDRLRMASGSTGMKPPHVLKRQLDANLLALGATLAHPRLILLNATIQRIMQPNAPYR